MRESQTARVASEVEVGAASVAVHSMADDTTKTESEGGYVDSGDETSVSASPAESETPPPPTSPTSTASQPPSPPTSSPTSPPTSTDASSEEGTETPELPPLIAAVLSDHEIDDVEMTNGVENDNDDQNNSNDQNDTDDDPGDAPAGRVILF